MFEHSGPPFAPAQVSLERRAQARPRLAGRPPPQAAMAFTGAAGAPHLSWTRNHAGNDIASVIFTGHFTSRGIKNVLVDVDTGGSGSALRKAGVQALSTSPFSIRVRVTSGSSTRPPIPTWSTRRPRA
jgi:hypothetical protein